MDITKLDTKATSEPSKPDSGETEIEGEVHDQEDLDGVKGAILKIDGTGEFKVDFYSPTRFRGIYLPPKEHEAHEAN
jgi:hypothetical protein